MKTIGAIILTIGLIIFGATIALDIVASNEYSRTVYGQWELADRSSTIQKKSEHIDKFYTALASSGFGGMYDAFIFTKPENSCDSNLEALSSLQSRLNSIKTLDENSFAYQSAIQQITAQEQGEAAPILSTLKGCWYRSIHPILWFDGLIILGGFVLLMIGAGMICISDEF